MALSRFPNLASVPKPVQDCQYAVRGAVVLRGYEVAKEIAAGSKAYDFARTIQANIGNPHAVGMKPFTYIRETIAGLLLHGTQSPLRTSGGTNARAALYLAKLPDGFSMGAYSHSQGLLPFREDVAGFINARDAGCAPCDPDTIFMSDGASPSVKLCLQLCLGQGHGVLVPIPQYPLYSAVLTLMQAHLVPYYLDEARDWGVNMSHLQQNVVEFKATGQKLQAMVVINPGNPTGGVLSREDMNNIVEFCFANDIMLLADEVYQANIYSPDTKPFVSFREVVLSHPTCSGLPLFSFHSASKGFGGECGLRGGYVQTENIAECMRAQMYKLYSVSLCSNTVGQATVALSLAPPSLARGDSAAEVALYEEELESRKKSMERKSALVQERLNALPGVSCAKVEGAMYAFPQFHDLDRMTEALGGHADTPADSRLAMKLLEETGVVMVPGSGFRQQAGTYHLRIATLPDETDLKQALDRIGACWLSMRTQSGL